MCSVPTIVTCMCSMCSVPTIVSCMCSMCSVPTIVNCMCSMCSVHTIVSCMCSMCSVHTIVTCMCSMCSVHSIVSCMCSMCSVPTIATCMCSMMCRRTVQLQPAPGGQERNYLRVPRLELWWGVEGGQVTDTQLLNCILWCKHSKNLSLTAPENQYLKCLGIHFLLYGGHVGHLPAGRVQYSTMRYRKVHSLNVPSFSFKHSLHLHKGPDSYPA